MHGERTASRHCIPRKTTSGFQQELATGYGRGRRRNTLACVHVEVVDFVANAGVDGGPYMWVAIYIDSRTDVAGIAAASIDAGVVVNTFPGIDIALKGYVSLLYFKPVATPAISPSPDG